MTVTIEMIITFLTIIIPLATALVWLIRLEGKVSQNAKDIEDNEKAIAEGKTVSNEINSRLTHIESGIARIEGYLKIEPKQG